MRLGPDAGRRVHRAEMTIQFAAGGGVVAQDPEHPSVLFYAFGVTLAERREHAVLSDGCELHVVATDRERDQAGVGPDSPELRRLSVVRLASVNAVRIRVHVFHDGP